jgi:hypothetical protein
VMEARRVLDDADGRVLVTVRGRGHRLDLAALGATETGIRPSSWRACNVHAPMVACSAPPYRSTRPGAKDASERRELPPDRSRFPTEGRGSSATRSE